MIVQTLRRFEACSDREPYIVSVRSTLVIIVPTPIELSFFMGSSAQALSRSRSAGKPSEVRLHMFAVILPVRRWVGDTGEGGIGSVTGVLVGRWPLSMCMCAQERKGTKSGTHALGVYSGRPSDGCQLFVGGTCFQGAAIVVAIIVPVDAVVDCVRH